MPDKFMVQNLSAAVLEKSIPALVGWNRLEGRPRTTQFDQAMRAEVGDALWMLTRQWQMGEFKGDDAGSPVLATTVFDATPLTGYQAGDQPEPFASQEPLETRVETRPVPFERAGRSFSLDLRLAMGRYWLKLIAAIGNYAAAYVTLYPIAAPDPAQSADADRLAHASVWQSFAAVAGRCMDGALLYRHLKINPANTAADGAAIDPADQAAIVDAGARFVAWFERSFRQPDADRAWIPERLEYAFACAAETDASSKVLVAEEYAHGHLDWYNLDVDRAAPRLAAPGDPLPAKPARTVMTVLPAPIVFPGMPDTRWWAFEERTINLGDVDAATTDLGKLLFLEFSLLYANDWYMLPLTIAEGAVASLRGIAVTNVFGERFFVEPAGVASGGDWRGWTMFTSTVKGTGREPADTDLLLLPVARRVQTGKPLDDVVLLRDEMANMVWGVEAVVPMPDGSTRRGIEAARETRSFFERRLGAPPPPPLPPSAEIRYSIMSEVPENWIPFVPVRIEGSNREVQLQRAALPRALAGDPARPRKILPRTVTLREGLDRLPQSVYLLHEEEVPRAGVRVTRSFQRTRWREGRTFVWLGMRKETGRGEGSSGLAFDQILPQRKPD